MIMAHCYALHFYNANYIYFLFYKLTVVCVLYVQMRWCGGGRGSSWMEVVGRGYLCCAAVFVGHVIDNRLQMHFQPFT